MLLLSSASPDPQLCAALHNNMKQPVSLALGCSNIAEEAQKQSFCGGGRCKPKATDATGDAESAQHGGAPNCSTSSTTSSSVGGGSASSSDDSSGSDSVATTTTSVALHDPPGRIRATLFIGSRETEAALPALRAAGITHVLQAGGELTPSHEGELEYLRLPLADAADEDAVGTFKQAFAFIDAGRRKGAVLVHCAQGMSRSGAIAVGYLMWRERLSLETALAHVQQARPVVDPNEGFNLQLREFERIDCDLKKWQGWDKQQLERCFRRTSVSGRCVVRGLHAAVRRFHVCDDDDGYGGDGDTVFDVSAVCL